MRGEQPRRTVADVRKGEGEAEREGERKFREACGDGEEGRRVREKSSKGTKDARMH